MSDQHPELSSPVAHVIQPEDREQTIYYAGEKTQSTLCWFKVEKTGGASEQLWTDRPENIVAQELKEATDALADDGGAQVTHMHLLGNVWRGEVHHHLQTQS